MMNPPPPNALMTFSGKKKKGRGGKGGGRGDLVCVFPCFFTSIRGMVWLVSGSKMEISPDEKRKKRKKWCVEGRWT